MDSGLPDFRLVSCFFSFSQKNFLANLRGNEGFWNAYPPMKKLGASFIDCANPRWFDDDPGKIFYSCLWGWFLTKNKNIFKCFYASSDKKVNPEKNIGFSRLIIN